MRRQSKISLGIVAVAILVILVAMFAPLNFVGQTVLSAQQINIESVGYESGGKIKGTYWSVVMTASLNDQGSFYEFDDSDVPAGATWNGKDVAIKNRIKIEIDPSQPYYQREIRKKSYVVVPRAYRNWATPFTYGRDQTNYRVGALMSDVYETETSTWELHTPFTVKVYKNGVLVGTQNMDLYSRDVDPGANIALDGKDITIGSGSEYLTVESLGALLQTYGSPNWPSVIGWSNQYLYLNSPTVQKAMHGQPPYPVGDGQSASTTYLTNYEGTYAWYWYGKRTGSNDFNWYWRDDGTPCPVRYINGAYYTITQEVGGAGTPGWKDDPNQPFPYHRVIPVQAVKFPTEEASDRRQYYCLTEYLESVVHAQKITSSTLMPSWERDVGDIQIDDPKGYLRIYLPYQAYNPLLVIRISSELADTFVWEPQVGNFKIVEVNGDTSTTQDVEIDLGENAESQKVSVKIKNEGDVAASGSVIVETKTPNASWAFAPGAFGTGTMQPGETKTFTFDVVDLTTTEDTEAHFRLKVLNSLFVVTDYRDFKVTLLPMGVGGTLLYIRSIDKETQLDVAGIHVIVT